MSYLATRPAAEGSRTITIEESDLREEVVHSSGEESEVGRLRLRGATRAGRPRVVWREDVVDNEGAGKKSSKICCIYHKPRAYDESSSEESSSSSDSDSDSDCDSHSHSHAHSPPSRSHPRSRPRPNPRRQNPDRGEGGSNTRDRDGGAAVVHELHDPADDANMYERLPKRKGPSKSVGKNKS